MALKAVKGSWSNYLLNNLVATSDDWKVQNVYWLMFFLLFVILENLRRRPACPNAVYGVLLGRRGMLEIWSAGTE